MGKAAHRYPQDSKGGRSFGEAQRMRKSNLSETSYTHIGIDVFEDALRQEDQPGGDANERNARRTYRWPEEEPKG